MPEYGELRGAAAEQHGHLVLQLVAILVSRPRSVALRGLLAEHERARGSDFLVAGSRR